MNYITERRNEVRQMNNDEIIETIEPEDEVGDRQHLNPDGLTDAEKGANIGGVGGALR